MTRRIDRPDTPADTRLRELLNGGEPRSVVVVAGAGSGKTTSLIKALDHLERNHGAALRGKRQKIACITYTNVAVDEIRTDLRDSPLVHAATINSFLWELVRPFQRDIADWVVGRAQRRVRELIEEREKFGSRVQQKTRDQNAESIAGYEKAIKKAGDVKQYRYKTTSDYAEGLLGHADIQRMVPELIHAKPLLAKLVAQQYPYCFVDESQDTYPNVVKAFKHVASRHPDRFRLLFFGDPMQQIYTTGIGQVSLEDGWELIEKRENYRSTSRILTVVNNIRARGDNLVQISAKSDSAEETTVGEGTARLFILPADDARTDNLGKVRAWLAGQSGDGRWLEENEDSDTRTLVIARRMAAARLGYAELFAAFNDKTPVGVHEAFDEGSAWPLVPVIRILVPMIEASKSGEDFTLISLLRTHCPRLSQESYRAQADPSALLKSLKHDVEKLVRVASDATSTVRDVLQHVADTGLIPLDPEFGSLDPEADEDEPSEDSSAKHHDEADQPIPPKAIKSFLDCHFEQIPRYYRHLTVQSPYSTQHGVKGAEFPRVLVVLDDAEGRHFQYSYDVLLGQKVAQPPKKEGGETMAERTLRLLYVCCSRATTDLAVVYFTADADKAYSDLLTANLFRAEDIYQIDDILI